MAQAQAQIAALQSDKEVLRLENLALQERVQQLSAATNLAAAAPALAPFEDPSRIKQLQKERDSLQKQLDAAKAKLAGRKGRPAASADVAALEKQLAAAQARLAVLEAKPAPYTADELALLDQSGSRPATATPASGKRPAAELPPGTVKFAAEAQRYFAAGQLDKAEEAYLQVLRQDQKNAPALANIAAIQLEENHLATAEMNLQQALDLAPDDAYSLCLLGQLKFREAKYNEALAALSRAAKLDPDSAEIQNYLGLTLSEKGLRGPAETALRKAIQLQPNYGSAHNNLAVFYITQQPPYVALARWHYQKALACGHPQNPDLEKLLDSKK